jgi:hypothetical protein
MTDLDFNLFSHSVGSSSDRELTIQRSEFITDPWYILGESPPNEETSPGYKVHPQQLSDTGVAATWNSPR